MFDDFTHLPSLVPTLTSRTFGSRWRMVNTTGPKTEMVEWSRRRTVTTGSQVKVIRRQSEVEGPGEQR